MPNVTQFRVSNAEMDWKIKTEIPLTDRSVKVHHRFWFSLRSRYQKTSCGPDREDQKNSQHEVFELHGLRPLFRDE